MTILPKQDPDTKLIPEIGQRDQLSLGDIRQTAKMYRCAGKANKTCTLCHAGRNAVRLYRSCCKLYRNVTVTTAVTQ